MASGWKSLSLSFPCGEWSLSDLLVPLITELENGMACPPRELVLEINKPNGLDELTVPELLWNGRLELVGIFAGECMYSELHRFERADQLRHLEIHLPEDCDDKATDVLRSIGTRFPALQGLKITLREDKWTPGEIWQKFVESHPELSCFSLDFPANHIDEFRCNTSNFRFKKFVIWMPELVDPNGELAEWIRTTDRLETLVLQSINGDEHSHDLQDLVRAIEENVSIRKIGLCEEDSGLIESDCEPTFKKFVTDLLKAISVKADFSALYLPIDLAEHLVARDQSMNVALMHLERLESINPNFILETHVAKYGSPYKIESMPVLLPAKEFVKRFPWEHSNRRPGPQDQVKLQVSMPTWGKGAFRKMLTYQSLSEDEQEEFVRDRLREADFSKEDVKVLGLISSEPEPENDYDMQLVSDLAEIFGAQGSEPRRPTH